MNSLNLALMRKLSYIFCFPLALFFTPSYSQSGIPDSTFGENGIVITDINSGSSDFLRAIAIQPDQKILAFGSSGSGTGADLLVVRYLTDGTPDPEFGTNGIVHVDFNSTGDNGHALTIQPDGKIVLAGETSVKGQSDFALARINIDGSLDETFGDGGKVVTNMGSTFEFPNAVTLQEDHKIIAAGRVSAGNFSDFGMVRYNPDGKVDSMFGVNGIVITSIRDEDEAKGIVIQPGGKIILGGFASVNAKGDFAMVRYLDDGTIDKTFGSGGKVLTDLEGTGRSDFPNSMIQDPNGNIVLAGNANFDNLFLETDFGIARYTSEGDLDQSFGIHGIYILSLGTNDQIQSIVRQPDGKYLVAGKSDVVFTNKWILARLKSEGGLDTLFGNHGIVLTDLDGTTEVPSGILIQNDSKIVVGGLNGDFAHADFIVARYIADFIMTTMIVSGVTCHGVADAAFSVAVSGGVPPYKYSLDGIHFQTSSFFFGLPAGEYTVTVSDASSPSVLGSIGPVKIDDAPAPPAVDVQVQGNTIIINVDSTGTYLYSIDNGVTYQSTNAFSNLPDGLYSIVVKDQNGCITYVGEANIQNTAVHDIDQATVSISPNPCSDFITIDAGEKYISLNINITDLSGRLIRKETLYPDTSGEVVYDVSALVDGIYFLTLNDGNHREGVSFVVVR